MVDPYSRKPPVAGVLLLAALLLGGGCAQTHIVRPLGKGNGALNVSVGGPFVQLFGAPIPVPIGSVGGAYGVRDDVEVFGQVDATALAFGVLHLSPGVAFHPVRRDGGWVPTVTVGGSLHLLTNFREARLVPQVTGAAAWRIRNHHLVYLGMDLGLGFQPAGFVPIWGPYLGGEARVSKRVGLALEVKWLEPHVDVRPLAPTWLSPGSQGYVSLLLGVNIYFGDVR
jgi:hypothetical protein